MKKQKYDNSKYEYVNSIGKQIMDEGEWMPVPIKLHGEVIKYLGRFEGSIFFYMLGEILLSPWQKANISQTALNQ